MAADLLGENNMMNRRMYARLGVFLAAVFALTACVVEGPGANLTKFKPLSSKERKEELAKFRTQQAMSHFIEMRDYRQAVAAIEEAVQANDDYDMAWLVRAQIYQALKTYDKAEESFARALALSPDSSEINNNYGWYLCSIKKDYERASVYFDKALADPTYPTPESAYLNKGICASKAGQNQMAYAYFDRALAMNPSFIFAYKERARAKLNDGEVDDADQQFRIYQSRVERLNADDLLLGWRISQLQGKEQNAYEYESQLRELFPYSDELQIINEGGVR